MFKEEQIQRINKQITAIKKTVYYGNYVVSKRYKVSALKKLSLRQIKGLLWRQASVIDGQRIKILNLRVEKIGLLRKLKYLLKNVKKESNIEH